KNKVWVNFHRGGETAGNWTDLDAPAPAQNKIKFSPAAVRAPSGNPMVFVVGADDKIYSRTVPDDGVWKSHSSPGGPLDSSPYAVVIGSSILVFVNGGGKVHQLIVNTNTWTTLTPTDTSPAF